MITFQREEYLGTLDIKKNFFMKELLNTGGGATILGVLKKQLSVALSDRVVVSQGLDSMISEVFYNFWYIGKE